MIVRISKVGLNSIPIGISDLKDGPGELAGHSLDVISVKQDESGLEFSHAGQGKYRQFTFIVSSGDFSFIKDINGRPVMALVPLE